MESLYDRLVIIHFKKESGQQLSDEEQHIWFDYHANEPQSLSFTLKEEDLVDMGRCYRSTASAWEEFEARYMQVPNEEHKEQMIDPDMPVVEQLHRTFNLAKRLLVAAVLVIVVSVIIFKSIPVQQKKNDPPVITVNHDSDMRPGITKAVLILADGQRITLDSAVNNYQARQGSTMLYMRKPGQLQYEPVTDSDQDQFVYNTIETPKGGMYDIVLSDGTKIRLNAASSIRFPVAFTGKERKVEITGEVYFDVAHSIMPFLITTRDILWQALSTRFNIMAYANEPAIETTLLDGRLKITRKEEAVTLQKGKLAVIKPDTLITVSNADTIAAMAWKEGRFNMNNVKLKTLFRQIERWYDADVELEDKEIGELSITSSPISRDSRVSKLFNVLQATNHISYTIKGRKITVRKSPKDLSYTNIDQQLFSFAATP